MSSRTVATSTTSSSFIRRTSSRLRGAVLSHSAVKAGTTQWSTAYVRARRSRSHGVGGLIDLNANPRSEVKPQRVDRWRTDRHCSYEMLCSSKLLADVCLDKRKTGEGIEDSLGIQDRKKGFEVLAFYVPQRYDGR